MFWNKERITFDNWSNYKALNKAKPDKYLESPADAPYRYYAKKGTDWFSIVRGPKSEQDTISPYFEGSGWKFHISVHKDDIEPAWNSISNYLQQEGIGAIKVATPAASTKRDSEIDPETKQPNPQAGKMIALYPCDRIAGKPAHTVEDWQRIINNVEKRLAEAGIRKGKEVITDRKVSKSMYSYYRSDKNTELLDMFFKAVEQENSRFVEKELLEAIPGISKRDLVDQTTALLKKHGIVIGNERLQELAQLHLKDFTADEIAISIPTKFQNEMGSRHTILKLPSDKRYKLTSESDPYAGLHIEAPYILQAVQQKAVKVRGITERTA